MKASDAALESVIAFNDEFLLQGQTVSLHCGAEVVFTRDCGMEAVGPGQKCDGAMAEGG